MLRCCTFISLLHTRWWKWIFTPLRVGGPPTPQAFLANSNIYTKNQAKTSFFQCFYMFFRQKRRKLHGFRHKVGPKQWFLQCFQGSGIKKVQCRDLPKPLKTPLFTLLSSIFPCANAAGQLKHIYKKSFKNSVFFNVFTFFSVKNAVMYTFFGLKSVQNTGFCSVFNALASKNHSKYRYLQCFFTSVRFSLAGSRPKWPKIPFQYPLKLRHPKIVEKTRKHHQYEVSVRNLVWAPPPAKADIATAILTNVIKHLV